MAKKISLSFAGGSTDVLYSAKLARFFSYEKNRDLLHQIYGGKAYYTSGSGLTGAGYLSVSEIDNDLILWGHYMVGGTIPTNKKVVGFYQPYPNHEYYNVVREPLYGYAPISAHLGLVPELPFVLSDGNTVAFLREHEIPEGIKNWQKIKKICLKKNLPYVEMEDWWSGGEYIPYDREMTWGFYNPCHFKGINALQFVDLSDASQRVGKIWKQISGAEMDYPFTAETLFVAPVRYYANGRENEEWVSKNPYGIFDNRFNFHPRLVDGELGIGKWIGDGNGVIWRRQGLSVHCFLELSWTEFLEKNPQMDYEGHPSWIEFEEFVSAMDWFSMTREQRHERLGNGISAKIQARLDEKSRQEAYERQIQEGLKPFRDVLMEHTELIVTFGDSLSAGNCEPGTQRFCDHFGLDPEMPLTIGQLVELKSFDRMIEMDEFQRVLGYVLNKNGFYFDRSVDRKIDDDIDLEEEDLLGTSTLARIEPRS